MCRHTTISIALLLLLSSTINFDILCNAASAASRRLVYTNMSYVNDPETMNLTAYIDRGAVNVFVKTFCNVESVIFEMALFVKTEEQQAFSNFRTKTIDFCLFLANPTSNLFLSLIWQHMIRNTNNKIIRECPVKKVSEKLIIILKSKVL